MSIISPSASGLSPVSRDEHRCRVLSDNEPTERRALCTRDGID
jgi:hypothetical protein